MGCALTASPVACHDLNLTMGTRGGLRPNAGRKTAFPGIEAKPFAMDFTPVGLKRLRRLQRRHRLSRNNILAHLVACYAARLNFSAPGTVYPGKAQRVLAIRMPPAEAELLRSTRERTGKSYSDIGEALVRIYGEDASFPTLPTKPARRRRRPAARSARRRATSDQGRGLA